MATARGLDSTKFLYILLTIVIGLTFIADTRFPAGHLDLGHLPVADGAVLSRHRIGLRPLPWPPRRPC
ncbi:hypothetical protein [Novosphingobium resinovorum]|uniref:hypothetical protein n=1 Tax=Novosphingobium resinovorum TaxID=158500 RepID=UPI003D2BF227